MSKGSDPPRRQSKRGGSRPGAGRKPTLDPVLRLKIGGQCEMLWQEKAEQTAKRRSRLNSKLRREMSKECRKLEERLKLDRLPAVEREKLGEKIFKGRTRVYRLKLTRPYRKRDDIIKQVQDEIFKELGVRVSARMVRRLWSEVRVLEKSLSAESDDRL